MSTTFLKGVRLTGTSGSSIQDFEFTLSKTERKELGPNGSVAAIGPETAHLAKLEVGKVDAKTLGIEPGSLSGSRLGAALINKRGTGVLQQLKKPEPAADLAQKLKISEAALYKKLRMYELGR